MGLWAYASSLNTPCPQDIAPIRATTLMASQTDFPIIVPTYNLHLYRILVGRSYLISEGYSTEVEIITQAEAWLLLGRAAHTTLPIP